MTDNFLCRIGATPLYYHILSGDELQAAGIDPDWRLVYEICRLWQNSPRPAFPARRRRHVVAPSFNARRKRPGLGRATTLYLNTDLNTVAFEFPVPIGTSESPGCDAPVFS